MNQTKLNNVLACKNRFINYYNQITEITLNSTYGISNATYRALRNLPNPPSKIFKKWASIFLEDKTNLDGLIKCINKSDFDNFHLKLGENLSSFWLKHQKQQLTIAHKNKLIDLFLKYLIKINLGSGDINKNLLKYSHVPLDSKTLPIINEVFTDLKLDKKMTMGTIKTQEDHDSIQEIVYITMLEYDTHPLLIDYYANFGE